MKKMIIAIALTLISFSSFAGIEAGDCKEEVLKVARSAMDQKAKAYGFVAGEVMDESLGLVETDENGTATYLVDAAIYKGTYLVSITVDSSCGLESLKISEY